MKFIKPSTIIRIYFVIAFFNACMAAEQTKLIVNNQSTLLLDSVVVQLQNKKVIFRSIQPGAIIEEKILNTEMHPNNHDVTIQAYVYDQNRSNFHGGLYHTDLGGALNKIYTITIGKDLKIAIK